jgi:2-polyprenyl-3-methyl-5-hydroxy-6-metoxy-1,4-benzoquinol methylase
MTSPTSQPATEPRPHVIPAWLVPLLSFPLRRLWDKPEQLVLPCITPGDRILEVGPGSGFFTLPMARAAGPLGQVVCVELQAPVRRRLLRTLQRRASGAAVQVRPCTPDDLQVQELAGSMDLAVAIDVLHETPKPALAIRQMAATLRPGGRLLIREPRGHCSESLFKAEMAWAEQAGLVPEAPVPALRGQAALFKRPL